MDASARTTHHLVASDFRFDPPVINAVQGDPLHIRFLPGVDSATVELAGSGTIYYVCVPHADMGMKGIVHVSIAAGVDDRDSGPSVLLFPNPARDEVRSAGLPPAMLSAVLTDASGRTVLRKALHTASPLNVEAVPTGAYGLRLIDATGATVLQRRLTVAR